MITKRRTTVNISLTPRLRRYIAAQVASGRYLSASEVVRDGLRLLGQWEKAQGGALRELRAKLAAGMSQIERGEVLEGERFFDELESEPGRAGNPARASAARRMKRKPRALPALR